MSLSLAVALGANLGDPDATMRSVRPLLAAQLHRWLGVSEGMLRLRWSPLFSTAPVGGPHGQPPYRNAAVLVERHCSGPDHPAWPDPEALLVGLQALEIRFGRRRSERWGPRTLDLDLLWCGEHRCRGPALELPHPRLGQRTFVLAPLAAIDPQLPLPGEGVNVSGRLAALLARPEEHPPILLPGRPGWPEGA